MKQLGPIFLLLAILLGCGHDNAVQAPIQPAANQVAKPAPEQTLSEARRKFKTDAVRESEDKEPVDVPPAGTFELVQYDSPVGKLAAYLSPVPLVDRPGHKHPAIIWIHGGDCNIIGDSAWKPAKADNDQSASAFRKAGIIMMFPSLRGGNKNPGAKEGFFGEVNDVLAAADFLAKQEGVDERRIYLGGHSTGGTLVLLVAECSARFRAVFSFGPVADVRGYGPEYLPFDRANQREFELRQPGLWLKYIQSPVIVFEGTQQPCNIREFDRLKPAEPNPFIHLAPVPGFNHFSVLAPMEKQLAQRILQDDETKASFTFADEATK